MNQSNDFIENILQYISERNILIKEYSILCKTEEYSVDTLDQLDDIEEEVYNKFEKISNLMNELEKKSLFIYNSLKKDSTLVSNFNLLYELIENEEFEKCVIVRDNINIKLRKKNITI